MSSSLAITLILALGLAGGCYAYRPTDLTPAPGAQVRVILSTTTDIPTFAPAAPGIRTLRPAVLEVSGVVEAAGGDTLSLRLGELRTASGKVPGVEGAIALIPVGRIARMQERRFQAGTTLLGGVGLLTLAAAAALAVLLAAIFKGF